jgi:hypothetical protein
VMLHNQTQCLLHARCAFSLLITFPILCKFLFEKSKVFNVIILKYLNLMGYHENKFYEHWWWKPNVGWT